MRAEHFTLQEPCENARPSWHGFMLTCKEGVGRNDVVAHVEGSGIRTRMLFPGNLMKHLCFDEMRKEGQGYCVIGDLANTDRIIRDTFWVGAYPGMTEEMIAYMGKVVSEAGSVNLI